MQAFDYENTLADRLGIGKDDTGKRNIIINEYRRYNESLQRIVSEPERLRDRRGARLSLCCSAAGHEHECDSCHLPMNVGIGFKLTDEMMPPSEPYTDDKYRAFLRANSPTICQACILLALERLVTWDNWTSDVRGSLLKAEERYNKARNPKTDPHWDELSSEQQRRLVREPAGEVEPENNFFALKEGSFWHAKRIGTTEYLCGQDMKKRGIDDVLHEKIDDRVLSSFKPSAEPFCATCRHTYLELRRITLR